MADELDTFSDLVDDDMPSLGGHTITGLEVPGQCVTMDYVNTYASPMDPILSSDYENKEVRITGELVVEDPETGKTTNVSEFMNTLKERFLILEPNFEAMEEYPALKDAYDQYKMLEKLLMENNKPKE